MHRANFIIKHIPKLFTRSFQNYTIPLLSYKQRPSIKFHHFYKRSFANVGDVITVKVPTMGESVSEGTLQSYQKEIGDYVDALDAVVVVETDKITVDIPAGVSGIVQEFKHKPGDVIAVGDEIFTVKVAEQKAEENKPEPSAATTPTPPKPSSTPEKPPQEKSSKPPSKSSQPKQQQAPPIQFNVASKGPVIGPPQPGRPELVVKMSRLRQKVAQRLKDSQNTAAMLTTFQEVNMSPLMDIRKKYKDMFDDKYGVKLGFMSAFVKAACLTLADIPSINAVIDNDNIIYHQYIDMSIAVGTPTGLMVPVIRNAHSLSFYQIEKAISDVAVKARNGTINIEDMSGGTFTISNGGVYGSLFGTPIINPPQSAILGMHGTKIRPVVENGQIVARPMMYLALTYDHRIVDGSEAVTFLVKLRDRIEDPVKMLLDV